ncbi:MAG TPA: hypothetical protein ENJ08_02555 [Gammaproteobacteria bacterium]|nr:hypothetical protein [Gammaproteobacteria bacterium]
MKGKSIKNIISVALLMSASQTMAIAEESSKKTYREAEVDRTSIRVASDGMGIIEDFSCNDCGFKVLKVTAKTKGYLKNIEMSTTQLVKQSKARVGVVRYAQDSNMVYEIRFSH